MAYDEDLAQRVREILEVQPTLVEKQMFGGIGFMLQGNMACGVTGDQLIVRVGAGNDAAARARPHARPFDFTGRPMKGWIYVDPEGCESEEDLTEWVLQGAEFALSLPAK